MIDTEEKARKKVSATWTDIDCGTEDAMHIKLGAMFEWSGRQFDNISVLMSKEEFERVQAGGKLKLHFNPMPLYER